MFKTINEILTITTLSKAQLDRNYYRIKDEYIPLNLIYKDKYGTRWIHIDLIPKIATRRRKRKYTEKDINALLHEDWSYFGTYCPLDKVSIEHCHAMMEVVFNYLSSIHDDKIKIIYFIENPDTNIHVHYLIKVLGLKNLKQEIENKFRKMVACNTLLKVYQPEKEKKCKSYITKDLLKNPNCWGYYED